MSDNVNKIDNEIKNLTDSEILILHSRISEDVKKIQQKYQENQANMVKEINKLFNNLNKESKALCIKKIFDEIEYLNTYDIEYIYKEIGLPFNEYNHRMQL